MNGIICLSLSISQCTGKLLDFTRNPPCRQQLHYFVLGRNKGEWTTLIPTCPILIEQVIQPIVNLTQVHLTHCRAAHWNGWIERIGFDCVVHISPMYRKTNVREHQPTPRVQHLQGLCTETAIGVLLSQHN